VAISGESLGGVQLNSWAPGVTGGSGPNHLGLLVTVSGKVTQRQTTPPVHFYIDDGAGLKDGTLTGGIENVGIRIDADPSGYDEGSYVAVTGISSCFESSGLKPRILPTATSILLN